MRLNNNSFIGTIPKEFFDQEKPNLRVLEISFNNLNGTIPNNTMLSAPFLTTLIMNANKLSGTIPSTFVSNTLTTLLLDTNKLSGTIPLLFGSKLTSLSQLSLHLNNLNGTIPLGFGNISYLVNLQLNNNNFIGTLPTDLYKCTDLEVIRLDSNKFSGTLPSTWGKLISLRELNIGFNDKLYGEVPYEWCGMNKLETVRFDSLNYLICYPECFYSVQNYSQGDYHMNGMGVCGKSINNK